mmetsp:Transcript_32009/g.68504  ORF Transcript_32009/g.68504 Transcript_32009/m.68504 type:complete len:218 (+) Transcript_32009:1822-2475(+)
MSPLPSLPSRRSEVKAQKQVGKFEGHSQGGRCGCSGSERRQSHLVTRWLGSRCCDATRPRATGSAFPPSLVSNGRRRRTNVLPGLPTTLRPLFPNWDAYISDGFHAARPSARWQQFAGKSPASATAPSHPSIAGFVAARRTPPPRRPVALRRFCYVSRRLLLSTPSSLAASEHCRTDLNHPQRRASRGPFGPHGRVVVSLTADSLTHSYYYYYLTYG